MCFISAVYARGYPMFWAGRMDRDRLRQVVDREILHGKSPMTETLPFVVCAFMWGDRQLLSQPLAKTVRKLKARNIVSTLLRFDNQSEFVRRARRGGTFFELDGQKYSIYVLAANSASATLVFERLVQMEYAGTIDDKLRSFAHRLDLILHANTN